MFIAVKKCNFDRTYEKGEIIPDKAIDKNMINKLIKCGIISEQIKEDSKPNRRKSKPQEQEVIS